MAKIKYFEHCWALTDDYAVSRAIHFGHSKTSNIRYILPVSWTGKSINLFFEIFFEQSLFISNFYLKVTWHWAKAKMKGVIYGQTLAIYLVDYLFSYLLHIGTLWAHLHWSKEEAKARPFWSAVRTSNVVFILICRQIYDQNKFFISRSFPLSVIVPFL